LNIFILRTNEPRRDKPGTMSFPFRCDYKSTEALIEALKDGPVVGEKIIYESISQTKKRVKRSTTYALTKDGFGGVEEARSEFVDPDNVLRPRRSA
jgi:hypothetical protein